jgi:DNA-binding NarL/FixJ family response regulator
MHGSALLVHREIEHMSATPILAITNDETLVGSLRSTVREELGQKGRIVVAGSVDDACPLLKAARPRVVVVHLTGESARYEQLDRLLWATSVASRRTPIVVIAERYRIDQATMMYRMGVSEYISRKHHLGGLAGVLAAYLRPATIPAGRDDETASAWPSRNAVSTPTAQVV